MSEERQIHPQEPAEGSEEDVEAPGAEKAGEPGRGQEENTEESSAEHPQEPAEGGEEDVEAPGAEKAGDSN